jgi:glycosyltransferase involved in cell wall biosynthesis
MSISNSKNICFFAKVPDKNLLELVQWYKNDIDLLLKISKSLNIATSFKEIDKKSDIYFSWWASGSFFPFIIAKLLKKPIIVIAGGSEVVKGRELIASYNSKSLMAKIAISMVVKFSDKIIAVSKELAEEVKKFGRDDVVVVYHGIDTEYYKPQDYKKDVIFSLSYIDFANVERKKLKTIINSIPYVLERFPNQKYVIAGVKGNAFNSLEKLIADLKIENNVEFPGKISNEKKLEYFQRSLIYLQPTIHEGFGVAIAEAMSCGVPVISSYNTAVKEVLNTVGFYCNPDDPKELASITIELLQNKQKRKQFSTLSRKRIVENFSLEKRNGQLTSIINSVLEL